MTHFHSYDLNKKDKNFVYCIECGFSVPTKLLASRTNLDAFMARKRVTEAVLDFLNIDRDGNHLMHDNDQFTSF